MYIIAIRKKQKDTLKKFVCCFFDARRPAATPTQTSYRIMSPHSAHTTTVSTTMNSATTTPATCTRSGGGCKNKQCHLHDSQSGRASPPPPTEHRSGHAHVPIHIPWCSRLRSLRLYVRITCAVRPRHVSGYFPVLPPCRPSTTAPVFTRYCT